MDREIEKLFRIPGKTEKIEQIRKITDNDSGNKKIMDFCNSYLLFIDNEYEEALKLTNKYKTFEFLFLSGVLFFNIKNYDEAVKYFIQSIEKDKNLPYPYNGLGNLYSAIKKYDEAKKYYKLSIEKDENFSYPYNGLGILYSALKKYDEAEKYYKLSIDKDENLPNPYNGLGNLYSDLKKYDEAEKYYKLSIEKDENFSYPYNGLGTLYWNLKKYDEAEKYYKLSIEKDENYSYPYNGLGNLYLGLKKYGEAEKYYKLSIDIDENYSSPYNGLGALYKEIEQYDEAERYYKLCIEKDENNSSPYFNLGLLYRNIKKYNKAREIVEKGLKVIENSKTSQLEVYLLARFNKLLTEIDNAENVDRNYIIIQEVKEEDPIKKILKEINDNKIDEHTFLNKKKFLNFIKPKQQKESENYFKVLRRWNSYTPIIADNYHISKGGGYFLKISGVGIVIDPGFNFIENFKGAGHVFDEIDAVFISHAHNDHTADLESILTLLYKYNEEIKDSDDLDNTHTIRHEIAKEQNIDYSDVTLVEINKRFLISKQRKIIDIYLTASTFKKSIGLFELFNKSDYKIHLLEPDGILYYKDIKVRVLKAKHHDIVSDYFSTGFAFYLKGTVLIYTGDTAWNLEIENQYKDLAEETKSEYKILIAHIGGFKEYEDLYLNEGYSGYEAFYKNHLGRLGIGKLNETLQPDIFLMSEFGEEIKSSRIKLCEIYEQAYKGFAGKNIKFFPADIGFKINLESKKIFGVNSIKQDPDEIYFDYIDQSEVNIAELRKDCSLHYYNRSSDFTESILIQILAENYDETRK